MSTAPSRPPDDDRGAVTPRRVLAWLDLVRGAIAARDETLVWELFACREARAAPRALLGEALALVRAPAAAPRTPLALLRHAWVVQRLDAAGEPLPGDATLATPTRADATERRLRRRAALTHPCPGAVT